MLEMLKVLVELEDACECPGCTKDACISIQRVSHRLDGWMDGVQPSMTGSLGLGLALGHYSPQLHSLAS